MKIRYKNYQIDKDTYGWSVCELKKVQNKKSKNFDEEVCRDEKYPVNFEACIHNIISRELAKDNNVYSLSEFLEVYRRILNEIKSEIKEIEI